MSEKSHVGMMQCWICGQGAEIILDTRIRPILDREMGSTPNTVCSECETMSKKHDGIWMLSIKDGEEPPADKTEVWNPYRTGGCVLVSKEAAIKSFTSIVIPEVVESTTALINNNVYFYVPDQIWDMIGLPERGKGINNLPDETDE